MKIEKKFYHNIFPRNICQLELKNRLIAAARANMYAHDDGTISERLIAYHEPKANQTSS